jgi:hypothetical protein
MLNASLAGNNGRTVQLTVDSNARSWRRAPWVVPSILAAFIAFGGSPAAANPLTDCWERIAVAVRHTPHPHAAHPVAHKARHVAPKHRPKIHKASTPGHAVIRPQRTRYILRPRACGTHEAMMTPMPGAVGPEAPELLLAELAGPPAPVPGIDVADVAPVVPPSIGPETFAPDNFGPGPHPGITPTGGFVGGGGPGGGGPGGPGGPGQPPVTPLGPPVTPPDGPPITPPGPPPVGPPPGVPEPATWAIMITGFFGIGSALRRRRAQTA